MVKSSGCLRKHACLYVLHEPNQRWCCFTPHPPFIPEMRLVHIDIDIIILPSFMVFLWRTFDWPAHDWLQSGDFLTFQPQTRQFAIWKSSNDQCTSWVGVTGPRLHHHSSNPTFLCHQMWFHQPPWCCMFWFMRIFYFNKWLNGVKLPTAPSNKVSANPSVLFLNHSSSSPFGLISSVEGCFF